MGADDYVLGSIIGEGSFGKVQLYTYICTLHRHANCISRSLRLNHVHALTFNSTTPAPSPYIQI